MYPLILKERKKNNPFFFAVVSTNEESPIGYVENKH